ncbi:neocarzinostatin apoprotein domain-containing protein [Streptomyces sp. NPDC002580]|uniref:neocarzinostatin apoprotein domain-containing protein n=1 Tax=Streptomyces sp. NPDC002580 TaxID=3364653 RepID=UPI00368E3DC4
MRWPSSPARLHRTAATVAATTVACVLALASTGVASAADSPGATARLSAATDLAEGQRITVTGAGFRGGLTSVAVGLCKKGYTGNTDCDLAGGAKLVNIGGSGRLPTITLTVHARFAGIDCHTAQCVVGISPLPTGTPAALRPANTVDIPVGFRGGTTRGEPSGAGRAGVPVTAVGTAASPDSRWSGPSTVLWTASTALTALCAGAAAYSARRRRPESPTPLPDTGGTS